MQKSHQQHLNISKSLVSVIVPTLGEKIRELQIKKCIESIRKSSANAVIIIIVVNGNRFDAELCDWLKEQADILFDYQATPSLPLALFRGRELVQTSYFSFLDDDDEYLPNAIDVRLAKMQSEPDADFLITNGYISCAGEEHALYDNFDSISKNPLKALFSKYAWLHNCNALFRTNSVPKELFADIHQYAEWTWLAFNLIMHGKHVAVLDELTFRYNYDTPGSLSKSEAYSEAFIKLYNRMLTFSPPTEVVRLIRIRISADWHARSVYALKKGMLRDAFAYHWFSLIQLGGLRYLSYSRHLILGWAKSGTNPSV